MRKSEDDSVRKALARLAKLGYDWMNLVQKLVQIRPTFYLLSLALFGLFLPLFCLFWSFHGGFCEYFFALFFVPFFGFFLT